MLRCLPWWEVGVSTPGKNTAAAQPLPRGIEEVETPAPTAASPEAPREACCGSAQAAASRALRQAAETVLPARTEQVGDLASCPGTHAGLCSHVLHLRN